MLPSSDEKKLNKNIQKRVSLSIKAMRKTQKP
jgi:hypothetical protein